MPQLRLLCRSKPSMKSLTHHTTLHLSFKIKVLRRPVETTVQNPTLRECRVPRREAVVYQNIGGCQVPLLARRTPLLRSALSLLLSPIWRLLRSAIYWTNRLRCTWQGGLLLFPLSFVRSDQRNISRS